MKDTLWRLLRANAPYLAAVAAGLPLALGEFGPFVFAMAGAVVLLPAACGPDVDEIVERTFDPDRR